MKISIVIPSYNECDSIIELFTSIDENIKKINLSTELIFVDDGSRDNSEQLIKENLNKFKHIKIIYLKLYKNFGKTRALNEGFKIAQGDFIITMDADLQDDPSEIKNFIDKLNENYDLVIGRKKDRKDPILGKKIPSKIFNGLIKLLFKVNINDINSGFKGYSKELAKNLNLSNDFHRLIPLIAHIDGYSITEISVNHKKRLYGSSKYGPLRFLNGINDLLYILYFKYFSEKPLHFYGFTGLIFSFTGALIISYLFVIWLQGSQIGNRPLLSFGILSLIIGLFSFMIGFIAQIINQNFSNIRKIKKKIEYFDKP